MMATGFYQYGMNNYYTLYTGGQFSNDYYSAALGQSFNTPLGGFQWILPELGHSSVITRARLETVLT